MRGERRNTIKSVEWDGPGLLIVTRDPGVKGPWKESTFFYHLAHRLNEMGFDVIRKRMWRDGHLTASFRQYVRSRDWEWCVCDDNYMLRDVCADFRKDGEVALRVEPLGSGDKCGKRPLD